MDSLGESRVNCRRAIPSFTPVCSAYFVVLLGSLSNLKNLADAGAKVPVNRHSPKPHVQGQRRLKTQQIQELIDKYKKGAGTTQLSREYGIHRTTVWAHLERAGIPRRPQTRKLTDAQVQQAAERYSLGLSLAAVAREFSVDPRTLTKEFDRAQVDRR